MNEEQKNQRRRINRLDAEEASILFGKDIKGLWYCRVYKGTNKLVAYRHNKSLLKCLLILNLKTLYRFRNLERVIEEQFEEVEKDWGGIPKGKNWPPEKRECRKQPADVSVKNLRTLYKKDFND